MVYGKPVISNNAAQPDHADESLGYLHDHDLACPGCGYNLRGSPSMRCSECGLDLTEFDPVRIEQIRHDIDHENVMIAFSSICLVVFGLIAAGITIPALTTFDPYLVVVICIDVLCICAGIMWWRFRRTTQHRMINIPKDRYRGISWVGNCAMFILAILSIPLLGILMMALGVLIP